jgi:hypothetical protein
MISTGSIESRRQSVNRTVSGGGEARLSRLRLLSRAMTATRTICAGCIVSFGDVLCCAMILPWLCRGRYF